MSQVEAFAGTAVVDEIEHYVSGRSVCVHEAIWRILKFDLHEQRPNVSRLDLHLPRQQVVFFREDPEEGGVRT